MVCGCRYQDQGARHHCRNCFADANYLRVLGVSMESLAVLAARTARAEARA